MNARRPYAPIIARISGLLSYVMAPSGSDVEENALVLGTEAFKIITHYHAPVAGEVEICFNIGDMVEENDVLAKLFVKE